MTKFKDMVFTMAALVISGASVNARQAKRTFAQFAKEPFTVRYMGDEGNYLLFQVIVNADHNKKTSLQILDKTAGRIHVAHVTPEPQIQTLKIAKKEKQELDFKLMIGNEMFSRSFAIL
ncbi:MAG: hypothetical protein H7211_02270 [Aquabacterium sp.]|nr:hypothetical protein [Ferruginibacter sp.]